MSLWVGEEKSVKKKKIVVDQFALKYKSETYYWTRKLNRDDYGVDKYFVPVTSCWCNRKKVLLLVVKE